MNYYFHIKNELELPEWSKDWKRYHAVFALMKGYHEELTEEYWLGDKNGIISDAIKNGASLPKDYEGD